MGHMKMFAFGVAVEATEQHCAEHNNILDGFSLSIVLSMLQRIPTKTSTADEVLYRTETVFYPVGDPLGNTMDGRRCRAYKSQPMGVLD